MKNHYHFIGIGGIGMSALARILLDKKNRVSGSDLDHSDNIKDLCEQGALISVGHSAINVNAETTVVYGSRINSSNPEYQAALALKCPILHRSELLAHLMQGYQNFAVAGTHGKTTTTSLLTSVFIENGWDPTYAIGGMLGSGKNGKLGQSEFFIAELDESDGSFLNCDPHGAIITNIEPEHMDYHKTEKSLVQSFKHFISHVKRSDLLFFCGDDERLKIHGKGTSYGFQEHNDARLSNFRQDQWRLYFDLDFEGHHYAQIEVALIGKYNALNAAVVFAFASRLNISEEIIRAALRSFPGVARRCQKKGERQSVLFIDDYAHHPTEIRETLQAIRQAVGDKRLIIIFQPHRYTRTRDLLPEFGKAFDWADIVYITDIYSSGEEPLDGISAERIVGEICKQSNVKASYLPRSQWDSLTLRPHDVVVTMGAGDITNLHSGYMHLWEIRKYRTGLVFGGLSCEHEISVRSSRFVATSLNPDLYEIDFFGINKKGNWVIGKEAQISLERDREVTYEGAYHFLEPEVASAIQACDIFLPILHGPNGEDGTIQGFFEMLGKPFIGPDHRSASISMDKVLAKKLAAIAGVPTPKYLSFCFQEWLKEPKIWISRTLDQLQLPVFVKPIHLGSSVGISKVSHLDDLEGAIWNAFRFDFEVMIEQGIEGCRELEFAVMGNPGGSGVTVPAPGEKLAQGDFVDYEKKYGVNAVSTTVNPALQPELLEEGRMLAKKAYLAVKASGMMRVDFLLDSEDNFWFFELNSIPGMQQLSLFPKIWKREGVEAKELMNRLIILALQRKRQQERHIKPL